MPIKMKRRRQLLDDEGQSQGWEEYFDYLFADEDAARPNLKVFSFLFEN
jgi:crooked neck